MGRAAEHTPTHARAVGEAKFPSSSSMCHIYRARGQTSHPHVVEIFAFFILLIGMQKRSSMYLRKAALWSGHNDIRYIYAGIKVKLGVVI